MTKTNRPNTITIHIILYYTIARQRPFSTDCNEIRYIYRSDLASLCCQVWSWSDTWLGSDIGSQILRQCLSREVVLNTGLRCRAACCDTCESRTVLKIAYISPAVYKRRVTWHKITYQSVTARFQTRLLLCGTVCHRRLNTTGIMQMSLSNALSRWRKLIIKVIDGHFEPDDLHTMTGQCLHIAWYRLTGAKCSKRLRPWLRKCTLVPKSSAAIDADHGIYNDIILIWTWCEGSVRICFHRYLYVGRVESHSRRRVIIFTHLYYVVLTNNI